MMSREKDQAKQRSSSRKTPIIAGAIAGMVSRFCIAPLDVVKIRLQLQPQLLKTTTASAVSGPASAAAAAAKIAGAGATAAAPQTAAVYDGIYGTMRTIVREEGVTALWKGNIPAELLYLTYGAAQFFMYSQAQSYLSTLPLTSHLPQTFINTISGGLAGGMATSFTYPFDLLRTRFAASKGRSGSSQRVYSGLGVAIRGIFRDEGVKGFYRGGGAALAQIVPYMGLFFGSYEGVKKGLGSFVVTTRGNQDSANGSRGDTTHPVLAWMLSTFWALGGVDAISGVMGGVFAKTGVFPLDTIRKRLQVQGPTRGKYVHGDIPAYRGIVGCGKDVVAREGWRGLYRGLTVSLLKAGPASAVTMWTYGRTVEVIGWLEGREG
ncbi:mitochondrial thiamine pyrophosphate transporter [Orbilia blumenaviensis]|uniref:Mitochondrial thiamine pyrophosphate carrier 1 n=1 Tax=Orbilia blumenaviensis TaxID=1796055 RepID=A0AAV9U5E2_9PEZI